MACRPRNIQNFPEFGENDPASRVMEANVRVPYQRLDKVVFTGQQEWVT
jgi:hypothetical protein